MAWSRFIQRTVFACLAACFFFIAQAQAQLATETFTDPATGRAAAVVQGEIIVKLKSPPPSGGIRALAVSAGLEEAGAIAGGAHLLKSTGRSLAEAMQALRSDPNVEYAQPNHVFHLLQDPVIPNDPRFPDQWNMNNTGRDNQEAAGQDIDAPEAWSLSCGNADVVIAIVDTGINLNHTDLRNRLFINTTEQAGQTGVDDDQNGCTDDIHGCDFTFFNFGATSGYPDDDNGHGSHVAGIAGASGNNGFGVAGVNWFSPLLAVKAVNASGQGTSVSLSYGIRYAVNMGAKIINLSVGGPDDLEVHGAINYATERGVFVVAGAGNSNKDTAGDPNAYPARYSDVLAVGGFTSQGERYWYSNFGPKVEIYAPSGGQGTNRNLLTRNVLSTVLGNNLDYKSGTSMAAPHVSGTLGLMFSRFPYMSSARAKAALLKAAGTATFLDDVNKPFWAWKLNAFRALLDDGPPDAPIIASPSHPNQQQFYRNRDVQLAWTEPMDSSGIEGYSFILDQSPFTVPIFAAVNRQSVEYTGLASGSYFFHVRARDGTGNLGETAHYGINIDADAPGPPRELRADGGLPSPWKNTRSYLLTWTNPPDHSGVVGVRVKYGAPPSADNDGQYYPVSNMLAYSTPAIVNGENLVFAWLIDQVGNADPNNYAAVILRYDDLQPHSTAAAWLDTSTVAITVGFAANDDPPLSGLGFTQLWFRKETAPGAFSEWRDTLLISTRNAGVFLFEPRSFLSAQEQEGLFEFYTQAVDNAGNLEPEPGAATIAKASTFFDSTPPALSNIAVPIIAPSSARVEWATDDEATGLVEYGASTAFGSQATAPGFSRSHSVSLIGLLSPAKIYYRITAANRTGLVSVSPIASFSTPLDVFVPQDIFGVADLSQLIQINITNPSLDFVSLGLSDGVSISTSLLLPRGVGAVDARLDGLNLNILLPPERLAIVPELPFVVSGGGVMTDFVAGRSAVELTLGEAANAEMDSGQSRLYLGYYAGIDPVAPGAIAGLEFTGGKLS